MKKIRWKKLEKQAFDHPYFEYKKHLLSEKEAEDILAGGDALGVDEFMRIVRERAERQDIDAGIRLPQPERKERLPKRRLITRLAVAAVAVLLIFAFLTFTEPGIAFAEAVRSFVVRIFEGDFMVRGTELSSGFPPIEYENIPETFESLEQAARIIGRPIANLSADNIRIASIRAYDEYPHGVSLRTDYTLDTDLSFSVTQHFLEEGVAWGTGNSTGNGEIVEKTLPNGVTLFAGNMDDGASFIEAHGKGVIISIKGGNISREDLLNLASEMRFIEP